MARLPISRTSVSVEASGVVGKAMPLSGKSEYRASQDAAKRIRQNVERVRKAKSESDELFRFAQELKNDVHSDETETPSSMTPDDTLRTLEDAGGTEKKRNRDPGVHGDSPNKSAQKQHEKRYMVGFLSDGERVWLRGLFDQQTAERLAKEREENGATDVQIKEVDVLSAQQIERVDQTENPIEKFVGTTVKMVAPFAVPKFLGPSKKESGDDGDLGSSAETGHLGGSEADQGYNRGGRTPGHIGGQQDGNYAAQHDTGQNSSKKQL